jgi:acyl carrier protein/NAD(P)-dependent dehydrogenase (short-subunit alcohol dehydrogenase family)
MKARGAEVLICQADVSHRQHMQQVIEETEAKYGPLNIVVHAAGVLDADTFMLVPQIDEQGCQRQFKPKIEGLQVLDEVLQDRNPELCLLTSSLSSVLGGLGYTPYAAGNLFMDAFVHQKSRSDSRRWLSVNLDAWQTHPGVENPESDIIRPEQGVDVLTRALAWALKEDINQMVVSVTDLRTRIDRWIKLQRPEDEGDTGDSSLQETSVRQERPQLSTAYVEPQSELEQKLAALWQDFFGLQQVGIHDNFFDLGATSLDMVQLSAKIKKVIGREVPVVTLFRYPTIGSLANHLNEDSEAKVTKKEQEKKRADEMQKGRRVMQNRRQLIKR